MLPYDVQLRIASYVGITEFDVFEKLGNFKALLPLMQACFAVTLSANLDSSVCDDLKKSVSEDLVAGIRVSFISNIVIVNPEIPRGIISFLSSAPKSFKEFQLSRSAGFFFSISYPKLVPDLFRAITLNTRMSSIVINGMNISHYESAVASKQAVDAQECLEELVLDSCSVDKSYLLNTSSLFRSLATNRTLVILNLGGMLQSRNTDWSEKLFVSLIRNECLRVLELQGNFLMRQGRTIGTLLTENNTLHRLNLQSCLLSSDDLHSIMAGIAGNEGLEYLNLSYQVMARYVPGFVNLRKVELALVANHHLTFLNLSGIQVCLDCLHSMVATLDSKEFSRTIRLYDICLPHIEMQQVQAQGSLNLEIGFDQVCDCGSMHEAELNFPGISFFPFVESDSDSRSDEDSFYDSDDDSS